MILLRSLALLLGYLSVTGGCLLLILKSQEMHTGFGSRLLRMGLPFLGLMMMSLSIITFVLMGTYVIFSILLVIGIHMNKGFMMILYLFYTGLFLVYYSLIFFVRYFLTSLAMEDILRFIIPIGIMAFSLMVVTVFFIRRYKVVLA